MDIFKEYIVTKKKIQELEAQKLQLEIALYNQYIDELKKIPTGTFNREEGQYKVKIAKSMSTDVDQRLAKSLAGLYPEAFKLKYSVDKKNLEAMPPHVKSQIEDCITTKPKKPTFTVEIKNAN
jgi:ABC-type xylose transport system substrate-binding protein